MSRERSNMTVTKEVIQNIVFEILDRWNRDQEKLDDDMLYSEIENVIEEVIEEYFIDERLG